MHGMHDRIADGALIMMSWMPADGIRPADGLAQPAQPVVRNWRIYTGDASAPAASAVWLAQVTAGSSYPAAVLPGLVLTAPGIGLALPTASFAITSGVQARDQGLAGALFTTSQQTGAAVGLAILATPPQEPPPPGLARRRLPAVLPHRHRPHRTRRDHRRPTSQFQVLPARTRPPAAGSPPPVPPAEAQPRKS
jgi:hypothetical protein